MMPDFLRDSRLLQKMLSSKDNFVSDARVVLNIVGKYPKLINDV